MPRTSAAYFIVTCCLCLGTEVMDSEPDGCSHCGSAVILVNEIRDNRPETSSNVAYSTISIQPDHDANEPPLRPSVAESVEAVRKQ